MPPKRKTAAKQSPKQVATPAPVMANVAEAPKPPTLPPSPSQTTISTLLSLPLRTLQDPVGTAQSLLFDRSHFWPLAVLLTAFNLVLGVAIILRVPYTKIDWPAYMQQVDMFLSGERDYSKIEGETGPLVYPALHLYIYTALHQLLPVPRERAAQYIWLAVEQGTLVLTATVYYLAGRDRHIPQWLLIPLVLSKRSHSIYLLRLFNDPLAMILLYAAVVGLQLEYWKIGSFLFSLALGIKMNILLFLPGLLVVLFQFRGAVGTLDSLVIISLVQLALAGFSFFETPAQLRIYFAAAFDFSRSFLYQWTVNWRFVPESIFLSKSFGSLLLLIHLALLILFGLYRWCPVPGGTRAVLSTGLYSPRAMFQPAVLPGQLASSHLPLVLFSSNLIGMACARSLHYQFQTWYFHQIPFLLYLGGGWGQWGLILGIPAMLEKAWDTYPATPRSSALMLAAHVVMISGLWATGGKPSEVTDEKDE
ncbi:hypothetical protein CcaverHIS002_0211610 [Cutaneotrichosporon cavernicola]|uniref:Dol-P-Man:Man(5)GlcNAc(2)-PP-Dol alpha-1,3-mannosyltransferase n=1 Tax=Cutaneotrichosporon cavernicola TaxID=279322 RepID=A0AA48I239_9TREE|nr:uncharacterized protein CcaverHIS019_0211610 [Cutaneotrichosporon cavernicola]BEI82001.1 hypothetical protein CcaverHIS002_0211610 [Cutaneotrichosporon cavernicola]BEI89799.1 hypothetical protein CcaverHIS019_0211610 [Cutaneotrichosporon cavernicola]BEI97570.1 hypothetical protein CcaverHIS631_0211590 [Cutaneotrichosporon cavernicola]